MNSVTQWNSISEQYFPKSSCKKIGNNNNNNKRKKKTKFLKQVISKYYAIPFN